MKIKDKVRGCLIGGAIGDALGYPIEFLSYYHIVKRYGNGGVRGFCEFNKAGKAVISDDTQMTLFTANGLLFGITRWCTYDCILADLPTYVFGAYREWYETQVGVSNYWNHTCWLRDIKELNVQRAPGSTCMTAMKSLCDGNGVVNDSKGCGGVMRVAPVALQVASEIHRGIIKCKWTDKVVIRYALECAEITHKHPLGYIPAAVFADILFQIVMTDEKVTKGVFIDFINKSIGNVWQFLKQEEFRSSQIYKGDDRDISAWSELSSLVNNAIRISKSTLSDYQGIRALGYGWTGDEALAIALFCALRHIDDFNAAVCAAVNHDGDSDSTGSICGNIMGAIIGLDGINFPDMDRLELADLIVEIADDISTKRRFLDERWKRRYIWADPSPFISMKL